MFLRNVGIYLQGRTALLLPRPTSTEGTSVARLVSFNMKLDFVFTFLVCREYHNAFFLFVVFETPGTNIQTFA
jgi:hypothetical protein